MSYRNDLDAAVARNDALQQEVKRLTDENAGLRAKPADKPRRGNKGLRAIAALSGLGLALAVGITVGISTAESEAAPVTHEPGTTAETWLAMHDRVSGDLAACADDIAAPPTGLPATANGLAELERTGAACRLQLREAAAEFLGGDSTLASWAAAEDQLANRISLISVYVAGDPYLLDHGNDTGQLWREYSKALVARDRALAAWRAGH